MERWATLGENEERVPTANECVALECRFSLIKFGLDMDMMLQFNDLKEHISLVYMWGVCLGVRLCV